MHRKNEYKKIIANLDYKALKKEYEDLNLQISKAQMLIHKGINPYGKKQDVGSDKIPVKLIKWKRAIVVQRLMKLSK